MVASVDGDGSRKVFKPCMFGVRAVDSPVISGSFKLPFPSITAGFGQILSDFHRFRPFLADVDRFSSSLCGYIPRYVVNGLTGLCVGHETSVAMASLAPPILDCGISTA